MSSSSAAAAASSSAVVATPDNNSNNSNNPLLKIWGIQRVLLFVQQKGIIFDSTCMSTSTQQRTRNLASIPRLLQLKNVASSWNETVEFYIYNLPSEVIVRFCQYLQDFVRYKQPKSEQQQRATFARDVLLWISKFIRDAASVNKWSECVLKVVDDNKETNRRIFGTEQVRDAFVMIAEFATSDDICVKEICSSVAWLTYDNENNQRLFGTTEILKCFLSLSKVVSSSVAAFYFCAALVNITNLKENQQLFGTEEIRDAMIHVAKYIEWRFHAERWLSLLARLTAYRGCLLSHESIEKLFYVNALLSEKQRLERITE